MPYEPFSFQVFQLWHDVGPVPNRNFGITHLLDYIAKIGKAKDEIAVGPIQQADIFAAAAQSDCPLNLFHGYTASKKSRCIFLICSCKNALDAGSFPKSLLDRRNIAFEFRNLNAPTRFGIRPIIVAYLDLCVLVLVPW